MKRNSGAGTLPAIIAVVLFIGGRIAVTALGDSIELSTGAWVPTLLLMVGFIVVFVIVMVCAASKTNRKDNEN
jgi:hypothetical protein